MSALRSPIVRPSSLQLEHRAVRGGLPVVSRSCVLYSSDASFRTSFCGLKLWMFNKLKDSNTKSKKVEIQAKDQVYDHLKFDASYHVQNDIKETRGGPSLCIAVVGATGELARNKVFPALFALYYSGCLPENVAIFGYSRKEFSDDNLRSIIAERLTCRVDHRESCGDKLDNFLKRTYHQYGGYDNKIGMAELNSRMEQIEDCHEANRIFYLSVPQEALLDVVLSIADHAQSKRGWNRIIIEKPFGFNASSSYLLTQSILSKFEEKQIYRIDHLLGKDLIENLTVLRFSNLVFEPLWSRTYIRNVQVIVSEECGMETRGRYFGGYGVIRDVVHSHILQTIALFAMEPPVSLDGEAIRNEKVKVLRSIRKLGMDDVVLGQHKGGPLENTAIHKDDLTPTFFAAALYIDNARWDGVPFLIKAGLGLIKHRVEIRIQFHHVPGNIYRERIGHDSDLATNELILRDLPDETILLKVNNKVPGLGVQLDASELNLLYNDKYNVEIPDSYEHLILDVIDGDNHLFMRSDELAAAWNILTPILYQIDENKIVPELYQFGGRGPVGAYYLGAKHGVRWADD
ncbi:Glucose-6-phosphate dehydrogenase (NADP(+)) protein [Dioscorea alata]|uniref:Glucose-6-phosphate dehydrogenase (NADP(+)) protein n=2 Tax=Dioscorea alata TaxID=55571 RepID=A0ACB7VPQ2_DIOAL|nr:Glucose-6-phosphate dehydrogenase (NADP(+)) protein [Dioscorea alata]KAH7676345.1 Glucose-6-phosphate dehydrogenase (NADP(+)) protein [Dioscorea alata]